MSFMDQYYEDDFNFKLQIGMVIFSSVTFIILFFIPAQYGKLHDTKRTFLTLPNNIAWILEEIPNIFITIYYAYINIYTPTGKVNYLNILMILPFFIHYVHRGVIYPLKVKKTKNFPLEVTTFACLFTTVNATMQCRSIFHFKEYSLSDLTDLKFLIGLTLFIVGMYLNIIHDYYMIRIKKENNSYVIPHGYLFTYVSCPNYLAEIVEWIGFALLCNTLSAWIFVYATIANLLPRAIEYHRWYHQKFKEYPSDRKALIPFLI
jgi:protein-S-isoprenylcysteine O-methyltransferase Ste14